MPDELVKTGKTSRSRGTLGRATSLFAAFCRERHRELSFFLAFSWCLLYFWQSFDFTARFFRIPLLALSLPVLMGVPGQGGFRCLLRSPLLWAVALLAAAGCLSAWNAPFPEVRSYKHIIFGWLALTLAGAVMKLALPDKALRLLLLGLALGLPASAAVAFLGHELDFLDKAIMLSDGRFFFFTGYPATLGLSAGFVLTGQLYFLRHKRRLISPAIDIVLLLAVCGLLLLSQSRIALLAVGMSTTLMFLWSSKKPLRAFALAVVAAFCLLGAALLLGQFSPLKDSPAYQRMTVLFTDPMKDHSVVGRLGLWEIGWELFKERPLTGTGMRMFGPMRAKYLEEHKEKMLEEYSFVEEGGVHAHNLALGVLSEMGLAGFLPLVAVALFVLLRVRKAGAGGDMQALMVLLFYMLCQGSVDYMLNKIIYSDLLFGTLGLFAGACVIQECSRQNAAKKPAGGGQGSMEA